MSGYKYIIGLAVLVAALLTIDTVPTANGAIASYAAENKSHHMTIGSRMPGDRLVLKENIIKDSSWMRIVTVEKTYNVSQYERITMVQALDQKTNGNGAYASMLNGGPGQSSVTIKLKSQRGHGINFVIEVYGR